MPQITPCAAGVFCAARTVTFSLKSIGQLVSNVSPPSTGIPVVAEASQSNPMYIISAAVEDSFRSFMPLITESPARRIEVDSFAVPVH